MMPMRADRFPAAGGSANGGGRLGALAATFWRVRRGRSLAVLLASLEGAQEAGAESIVHPYKLCVRPVADLLVARLRWSVAEILLPPSRVGRHGCLVDLQNGIRQ